MRKGKQAVSNGRPGSYFGFRTTFSLLLLGAFFTAVFAALAGPDGGSGFEETVARCAREHGLDPDLVEAVILCESSGRASAVSRAGAMGLMQVMPGTAAAVCQELGLPSPSRSDLLDPEINIRIGTYYLSKMIRIFDDIHLALAAYNAGPTNVRRWMDSLPAAPGAEVVRRKGFRETRAYVVRVLDAWKSRKIPLSPAD
ncbi:MAG: lytic transglycosylase domain-containing protein [Planctomycetota bacterium]